MPFFALLLLLCPFSYNYIYNNNNFFFFYREIMKYGHKRRRRAKNGISENTNKTTK